MFFGPTCGPSSAPFSRHRAHGCDRHQAFPAPCPSEGETKYKTRAHHVARTQSRIFTCHRPRRRAIQYARGSRDGSERPQRTGSPACAGDDGGEMGCIAEPVIGRGVRATRWFLAMTALRHRARTIPTVVPAKAGTHYPNCTSLRDAAYIAFTTKCSGYGSRPSPGRQRMWGRGSGLLRAQRFVAIAPRNDGVRHRARYVPHRRPGEGRDPLPQRLIIAGRWGHDPVHQQMQWLWVPAFAGTTANVGTRLRAPAGAETRRYRSSQ